jgi:hypothetical protein
LRVESWDREAHIGRMGKRGKILFAAGCVVVTICTTALITHHWEPRYKGRTLSYWLERSGNNAVLDRPPDQEATTAIRTIGTNALPFLLRWIRYEPPFWSEAARKRLPETIKTNYLGWTIMYGRGRTRAELAALGLCILHTNANSAIPELRRLVEDRTHPLTAAYAAAALMAIQRGGSE